MNLGSSSFLAERRPLLSKLQEALSAEYAYASVLAMDNIAYNYRVSGSGISASQDGRFSNRGFVIRVRDEKGYAEYSFNKLEEADIPEIVKEVAENLIPQKDLLPANIGFMKRPEPVKAAEKTVLLKNTEYEIHPAEMGTEAILAELSKVREHAKSKDPRILDANTAFSFQEIHKIFLSDDKDLEQNILWSTGTVALMALKERELKDSYKGCSLLGGAELLKELDGKVDGVVKNVLDLLSSEPMIPGEYECVCDPETTGMIVHEAFGHGVEMDMFVKDRALAKYCIGERVASDLVTMHDGAAVMQDTGTYFFDDDGNLSHDTVIIEKGILKTGISDELSAESLGIPSTGNGRRESYERKAYTRMTNTYFEPGTDKLEDMIASIEYGFLLQEPSSGMEDPKNWGIQCMVNIAREIKDGKLTGRIFSPIVLTGYVPDLLKSISMMSGRSELLGTGFCGKGHKEWGKVSDGGPYIKAKIRLG